MADKNQDSAGDWTAGIVAIIAALLLGGGVPIGLYFGLLVPKQKEVGLWDEAAQQFTSGEEQRKVELQSEHELRLQRKAKLAAKQMEAETIAAWITGLEEPFVAASDPGRMLLKDRIGDLASEYKLEVSRARSNQMGATIVTLSRKESNITFPKGLVAIRVNVEAQAKYHDFGKFVAALESLKELVIIPEKLVIEGDSGAGQFHEFRYSFFVLERRDVDSIGREKKTK